MQRLTLKLIQILLATTCLFPLGALAIDGTEVLLSVDRNLNPPSYESYRKLINIEPDGTRKEFVLYSAKQGRENTVSMFVSPATDKGRVTLRQGDNMWLYIPDVGKPIRITSMQSIVGGVFNNADILRLDYSDEYKVTNTEELETTYLLTLKAKTSSVAYDSLKMTVDKKLLQPTEILAYAASGMEIKTISFKDIKDFGDGIRRPATVETTSPLYKGFKSVMLFANLKKREFADEVFTLSFLPRIEELRQ